jgi:hypothetical protein
MSLRPSYLAAGSLIINIYKIIGYVFSKGRRPSCALPGRGPPPLQFCRRPTNNSVTKPVSRTVNFRNCVRWSLCNLEISQSNLDAQLPNSPKPGTGSNCPMRPNFGRPYFHPKEMTTLEAGLRFINPWAGELINNNFAPSATPWA